MLSFRGLRMIWVLAMIIGCGVGFKQELAKDLFLDHQTTPAAKGSFQVLPLDPADYHARIQRQKSRSKAKNRRKVRNKSKKQTDSQDDLDFVFLKKKKLPHNWSSSDHCQPARSLNQPFLTISILLILKV